LLPPYEKAPRQENCRSGGPGACERAATLRSSWQGRKDVRRKGGGKSRGRPSDFLAAMTRQCENLLRPRSGGERCVVLFGETLRQRVQDMGLRAGATVAQGFRAFAVAVDGKDLTTTRRRKILGRFGIESSPATLPGSVLVGGGRRSHLRADGLLCPPAAAGRFGAGRGARHAVVERYGTPPRAAAGRGVFDPQVDLGRLPGPERADRRSIEDHPTFACLTLGLPPSPARPRPHSRSDPPPPPHRRRSPPPSPDPAGPLLKAMAPTAPPVARH